MHACDHEQQIARTASCSALLPKAPARMQHRRLGLELIAPMMLDFCIEPTALGMSRGPRQDRPVEPAA